MTKGLRSASLRYFNAAGASHDAAIGEDWTFSINLIPLVMKAVLGAGPPVQVFGDDYPTPDGTCIRDYIHVEDLADAHIRALDRLSSGLPDGATSVAVNLGTGVGSSVLDVIKATEAVAGRPVPHEIVGRRAGDPVATYADPTHAESVLGWRAKQGLDEIVEIGVPLALQGLTDGVTTAGDVPDPVEPAEEDGDRPRVVAQAVAGADEQAQLGAAVGLGELAGVGGRHALVVVAVHHEQRPRGEAAGGVDRAEAAERPAPLVDGRRERRRADRADLPGVLEEAAGVLGPVVEVGTRAEQAARPHPRVVGADADGDRAAGVRAEQHDLGRLALAPSGSRSPCAGRRPSPAARSRPRSCRCRGS